MKQQWLPWGVVLALIVFCGPAALSAENRMLVTPQWLADQTEPLKIYDLDSEDDEMYISTQIALATSFDVELLLASDGTLLPIEELEIVLGEAGFATDDRLVLYDNVSSLNAAFLYYVLDYLGHSDHYVLDGGIDAWIEFGGKVAEFSIKAGEEKFKAFPNRLLLYVTMQMQSAIGYAPVQLIDVRSYDHYAEGHIPSSTCYYWGDNMARIGGQVSTKWKTPDDLAVEYASLNPEREVVCYGANPMMAAHSYFAVKYLGFEKAAVYVQSLLGWQRDHLPEDTSQSMGYTMLELNKLHYLPLDPFILTARMTNPGASQMVDFYVLLEVYGQYFFYPTWTNAMDCAGAVLEGGKNCYRDVLRFQLPADLPTKPVPYTFIGITGYLGTLVPASHHSSIIFYFYQ